MHSFKWVLSAVLLLGAFTYGYAQEWGRQGVHAFSVKMADGTEKPLADYQGKVLLIVNTATQCGYTPQLASMEKLYQQYKARGLEVLAFPSNSFRQDPGTDEEIKKFCLLEYKTSFPIFSKISVKGEDIDPLYQYLTTQTDFSGPITWNFNKFLVAPDGEVIARFATPTDPLAGEVTAKIEGLISGEN